MPLSTKGTTAKMPATVQAINPGFSRWSKATKNRRKAPIYQGIAAKKNPSKNLQNKTNLKSLIWIDCPFILNLQVRTMNLHKLLNMNVITMLKDGSLLDSSTVAQHIPEVTKPV